VRGSSELTASGHHLHTSSLCTSSPCMIILLSPVVRPALTSALPRRRSLRDRPCQGTVVRDLLALRVGLSQSATPHFRPRTPEPRAFLARITLLLTRLKPPCTSLLAPGRSPPLKFCSCTHTPTPPASVPCLLRPPNTCTPCQLLRVTTRTLAPPARRRSRPCRSNTCTGSSAHELLHRRNHAAPAPVLARRQFACVAPHQLMPEPFASTQLRSSLLRSAPAHPFLLCRPAPALSAPHAAVRLLGPPTPARCAAHPAPSVHTPAPTSAPAPPSTYTRRHLPRASPLLAPITGARLSRPALAPARHRLGLPRPAATAPGPVHVSASGLDPALLSLPAALACAARLAPPALARMSAPPPATGRPSRAAPRVGPPFLSHSCAPRCLRLARVGPLPLRAGLRPSLPPTARCLLWKRKPRERERERNVLPVKGRESQIEE
jgi:hypothetical protein